MTRLAAFSAALAGAGEGSESVFVVLLILLGAFGFTVVDTVSVPYTGKRPLDFTTLLVYEESEGPPEGGWVSR